MMMKSSRLLPFAATAVFALAAITTSIACDRKSQAANTQGGRAATTVPVILQAVKTLPVQRTVDVVGTLYGEEETVVSAKVPGRIIALYKDVGDTVAPGEPLVQLKQNDYQLAVSKAQLAMEEALSKLGLKELPSKDYDVTKVPTVVKAKLQAENAEARFNRGKKLFESKPPLMSEQDFADLETALRVARSTYDVELLSARSLVAQAWSLKGDLDIAQQRLTDATTRAPSTPDATTQPVDTGRPPTQPHSYIVTARYVNTGELVREITACYRLVDDSPIKLRAKVPERHVAEIQVGQKVRATVEAYPGVDFWGSVSRVNPQIDPDNRTFSIEVLIPNDDHRLKPGAFARASVQTRIDPNVVFAPQEAVITFAGVNKVFTVKDNKAVEITIDPGEARAENNNFVEIATGLKGNEQLVVSGASKLATGVPVTLRQAAATQTITKGD
ncbi:MAG TPA: efflux RND transporter periplasmic adaptor subunit [Tepidisphaeraceae bacterium]|jgi:multidrug efflux pump subunit AcrA (membrane-fusion protein)